MSKESKLNEKHQAILADALRADDNRLCADCLAKGPRWASWNLGVFLCIRCAGIHRNLGVHISRVKSVNLDSWTPQQIQAIQSGGNKQAREKFEGNLPANFRRPLDDYAVEQFIRNKYERRLYVCKEGGDAKASKALKKEGKRVELKASPVKRSPSPQPKTTTTTAAANAGAPRRSPSPQAPRPRPQQQPDLIALETTRPAPPVVDLLTGLPQTTPTSSQTLSSQTQPLMGGQTLPSQTQPLMGGQTLSSQTQPMLGDGPASVKDNIMSLYSASPQPYSAQHGYQYQQSAAAVANQHRTSAALAQVQQVQQQMRTIKQQAGGGGGGGGGGGQTLNPHLW